MFQFVCESWDVTQDLSHTHDSFFKEKKQEVVSVAMASWLSSRPLIDCWGPNKSLWSEKLEMFPKVFIGSEKNKVGPQTVFECVIFE